MGNKLKIYLYMYIHIYIIINIFIYILIYKNIENSENKFIKKITYNIFPHIKMLIC